MDKSTGERVSARFSVRMTPTQKSELQRRAEGEGLSLSAYMRSLIFDDDLDKVLDDFLDGLAAQRGERRRP